MENNNEQRPNINNEEDWNPFTATPEKDSDEAKAQEKFLAFHKEFNPIINRYTRDAYSEIFHVDEETIKIPEIKTKNKKNKQKNKKKAKESFIAQQKKEKKELLKNCIVAALEKDIELKRSRNMSRDYVTKSIEEFVTNFFNINDEAKGRTIFGKVLTETEKLFRKTETNPKQQCYTIFSQKNKNTNPFILIKTEKLSQKTGLNSKNKQYYMISAQKNENTNPLTFFEKAKKELDKFGQKNDDIAKKMTYADDEYIENTIKGAISVYLVAGLLGIYSKHAAQYNCRSYIKATEVKKYDIICIEQCEAKKYNTRQPERRTKIGIVINTDGGRIDCVLLNSHDDNKHYPNMEVGKESVKVNNKDIYIGDQDDDILPFDNIFVNNKNTSYISKDTYALTDSDKKNIYRCGFLEKDNKSHIKLMDDIKAAATEGINNGYDNCKNYDSDRQIKYSQLLEYIKDFFEKNNNKNAEFIDKDDKKKKEKNNDKQEDLKQEEDGKEKNNTKTNNSKINLNNIGGINLEKE